MTLQIGSEIELAECLLVFPAALSHDDELRDCPPSPNELAPDLDQQGVVLARLDR
jgi:hypothetical protein